MWRSNIITKVQCNEVSTNLLSLLLLLLFLDSPRPHNGLKGRCPGMPLFLWWWLLLLLAKRQTILFHSGHSSSEVSLCDALQSASILFKQSATRLGDKRVFLFTNEDDPFRDDPTAKRAALLRALDLKVRLMSVVSNRRKSVTES